MRLSLTFILILVSNLNTFIFACGFYPYGEDIRFSIFNPDYFDYKDFSPFYYSTHSFSPANYESLPRNAKDQMEASEKLNVDLWRKRYNYIPTDQDVYEAVYLLEKQSLDVDTINPFVQYLHKIKDFEALEYLKFIKKCGQLNTFIADPWERNELTTLPHRTKLIKQALEKARFLKDEDLKLRYAFIAIRLAYYNHEFETINNIYKDYFSDRKDKNILDYWAMYFKTLTDPQGALRNYYASLVFANAPDKRFMIHTLYDKAIPISETLRLAKNNKERAAVWLLAGIRNHGKALESIKNLYSLDPHSEGLTFLLLREINKLEDWIYTPYYTQFGSSLSKPWESESSHIKIRNRIIKDKVYAKDVLNFINSINKKKVDNLLVWKIAKAYLLHMTEDNSSALAEINSIQITAISDSTIQYQIEIIKALCLIARQSKYNARILEEVKPVIMRQHALSNCKFIFAIARELEYKGNTTDAAILLSKLTMKNEWQGCTFWKSRKKSYKPYGDFYDDYFTYLDVQYSAGQIKELISNIENNQSNDSFNTWKYSTIRNDIPRLYDLLGTKYLREDNLNNALRSFEKVNDSLWTSKHYTYKDYIDANPFYTNFYNEHSRTKADTTHYNKVSITRTLIDYLKKAEDVKEKDRDYYYYLVANCYLNMTHYGNSWMMKRYYWSSSIQKSDLPGDNDYVNCEYAKRYYLKAKAVSTSDKFSALCLRMAGRCEKYRLINKYENDSKLSWEKFTDIVFEENKYYKKIKDDYPDYYDDLISNCESFESYLNARNF